MAFKNINVNNIKSFKYNPSPPSGLLPNVATTMPNNVPQPSPVPVVPYNNHSISNRFALYSYSNIKHLQTNFANNIKRSNAEAKDFLAKNGKVIVRMRGLPFNATAKDVVEFFSRSENSCEIIDGEEGALFVHYPDGRSTGDAFVMFKSEDEAAKALLKHRESMGPRYIELFRSTSAEVQQVLKRSQDPKFFPNSMKDNSGNSGMMNNNGQNGPVAPLQLLPPEMILGSNQKDCVRLRNLPLDCAVEQILEYLGIHAQHIIQHGVHMVLNTQGQPSGEAFIQFDSEQGAYNVFIHKNGKSMHFAGKKFHIEVIQCSGEEMNLVLMGFLPSNLINSQQNIPKMMKFNTNPKTLSNGLIQYSPGDHILAPQPQHPSHLPLASSASQLFPSMLYPPTPNLPTPLRSHNLIPPSPTGSTSSVNTQLQINTNQLLQSPLGPPPPQQASAAAQSMMPPPPLPVQHMGQQPYHPQIFWYYPTPPVSPSTHMYLPQVFQPSYSPPCVLVVKGAPTTVTINEILQFFSGYDIYPDCIQMHNPSDGYTGQAGTSNGSLSQTAATVDVLITLFNRNEAERAVLEKNHQKLGANTVELFLSF